MPVGRGAGPHTARPAGTTVPRENPCHASRPFGARAAAPGPASCGGRRRAATGAVLRPRVLRPARAVAGAVLWPAPCGDRRRRHDRRRAATGVVRWPASRRDRL